MLFASIECQAAWLTHKAKMPCRRKPYSRCRNLTQRQPKPLALFLCSDRSFHHTHSVGSTLSTNNNSSCFFSDKQKQIEEKFGRTSFVFVFARALLRIIFGDVFVEDSSEKEKTDLKPGSGKLVIKDHIIK